MFVDGVNFYRFVQNNPIRYVDPDKPNKQQLWEKEFRQKFPELKNKWRMRELTKMTEKGVRVLSILGITPRHFYERENGSVPCISRFYSSMRSIVEAGLDGAMYILFIIMFL